MKTNVGLVRSVLQECFGDDVGIPMSAFPEASDSPIASGIAVYDFGLLGVGGHPIGHFVEIKGQDKAGKTTLLMHLIASAQENDFVPLVIDSKGATVADVARNERIGVDAENALIIPIQTTEDALQKVRMSLQKLQDKKTKVAIFWDDMGVVPPEAELNPKQDKETKKDNVKVGAKASSMWRFCRSLAGQCWDLGIPMTVVNQLTAVIATGYAAKYAEKETTAGGGGLRYTARIRVDMRKGKFIKKGKTNIGQEVFLRTEANCFFNPFRSVKLALNYANGFDSNMSTLINAEQLNLVKRKGLKFRKKGAPATDLRLAEDWEDRDIYTLECRMYPWIEEGLHGDFDDVDVAVENEEFDEDEESEEEYANGFDLE